MKTWKQSKIYIFNKVIQRQSDIEDISEKLSDLKNPIDF